MPEAGGGVDTDGSRKRYTGHEWDAGTNLDYMLARYYGGAVGRFASVDPSSGSIRPRQPLSWNRLPYVLGRPLDRVDPTGRSDEPPPEPFSEVDIGLANLAEGLQRAYVRPAVVMAQATVAFGRAMVKHGRISLGWEVAGRTTTIDTDGNVSVGGELDFVGGAVGISGSPNGEVTVTGELGPPNSRLTIDSHGNAGLSEGLDTPIGGVTVNHSINLKDVPLVVSAVEAAFQTANQQPLANPCLCSSELTGSEMLRQNATWRLSPDPDDE